MKCAYHAPSRRYLGSMYLPGVVADLKLTAAGEGPHGGGGGRPADDSGRQQVEDHVLEGITRRHTSCREARRQLADRAGDRPCRLRRTLRRHRPRGLARAPAVPHGAARVHLRRHPARSRRGCAPAKKPRQKVVGSERDEQNSAGVSCLC